MDESRLDPDLVAALDRNGRSQETIGLAFIAQEARERLKAANATTLVSDLVSSLRVLGLGIESTRPVDKDMVYVRLYRLDYPQRAETFAYDYTDAVTSTMREYRAVMLENIRQCVTRLFPPMLGA